MNDDWLLCLLVVSNDGLLLFLLVVYVSDGWFLVALLVGCL